MSDDMSGLLGALNNVDAGGCPAPFISESLYPYRGGSREGRNCVANPLAQGANATNCCAPCPIFNIVYDDSFPRVSEGSSWIHMVGFTLCAFLLLSMAVLPYKYTRRAYLNIMLLVGICILSMGFIIPLAAKPNQCLDAITPNDMHSDMTCAWGGGMATFGGMFLVTWILARSLFMHLQICWNFAPGRVSYIVASVLSLAITIGLTAGTLVTVGVSYRYGNFCHINSGMIFMYWGWLLGFAGVAFILQLATFGYCLKVYVTANLLDRQPLLSATTAVSSGFISRRKNAKKALSRVQQVLLLQWRSLAIVVMAIFTFAWVCTVFIVLDSKYTNAIFAHVDLIIPWIVCLLEFQDNDKCTHLTGALIVKQGIAEATLYILSFVGVEAFFLLCRLDVFVGWWKLIKKAFGRNKKKPRKITDDDFVIMRHSEVDSSDHEQTREEDVEKTLSSPQK